MIRRYRKAEITALTMATTASQNERASTAAAMISNLATKPEVRGTPAWASSSTVKARARAGRRALRPRRSSSPVRESPGPDAAASTEKVPITRTE